jgi:steroid delta-isomerase-like uncharacterized protein
MQMHQPARENPRLPGIVGACFDAWDRRDADGIVATLSTHGTYQDPTTSHPLDAEALGEGVRKLWRTFPDLALIVGEILVADSRIALRWRMTGTHLGTCFGLPPTGRRMRMTGAHFIELSGGRIDSIFGHFDPRALAEQLAFGRQPGWAMMNQRNLSNRRRSEKA